MFDGGHVNQRLNSLEQHLERENPVLAEVVGTFRELDGISRRLGFLSREESHAVRTPWWPLISVLGVYSSGKSTFINHYLQYNLQATGNQAVDDKFTVICFTTDDRVRVLPGLALDADARFPFYKISRAIRELTEDRGDHIDAYLQLKSCPSEKLRGRIFIDSPGFDADTQRTAILRITDHIIDLSDLVLVFFDARHPESGSMSDTLERLVRGTINRSDANKFLYILNQIDNTAREDNSEEVFAAWQRALTQYGLTAGQCYAVYIPEVSQSIDNESVRIRLERKRDKGLKAIYSRLEQVRVERAYRIAGMLEQTARMVDQEVVPLIQRFITAWRRKVILLDGLIFGGLLAAFLVATIWGGYWKGLTLKLPLWETSNNHIYLKYGIISILILVAGYIHFAVRRWSAHAMTRNLLREVKDPDQIDNYTRAFRKNSRWWRSLFYFQPSGWGSRTRSRLLKVLEDTSAHIEKLNDMYTNPSGEDRRG